MKTYLVRMTLHYAMSDNYDTLHELMKNAGFSRTVTSDAGDTFQLPDGEYMVVEDVSFETVVKLAQLAGQRVGLAFSVMVTEVKRMHFDGLDRA